MKSLKFLRDVAVSGIHRESGTIHEIDDKDAAILIADGAAVTCEKPVKASLETAEAKRPGKEKATR